MSPVVYAGKVSGNCNRGYNLKVLHLVVKIKIGKGLSLAYLPIDIVVVANAQWRISDAHIF